MVDDLSNVHLIVEKRRIGSVRSEITGDFHSSRESSETELVRFSESVLECLSEAKSGIFAERIFRQRVFRSLY